MEGDYRCGGMAGVPAGTADRRAILRSALLMGAGLALAPSAAWAAPDARKAIRAAAEASKAANIKRIQDWIGLPTIAAENRNVAEGAAYMMDLAREAGFGAVRSVPSDGFPGVFGVMDNGAKHTLGLYFMYDVKQYDPAEWSSPPLEARIVDKPGFGKAIVGRGAVNQKGPQATLLAALHAMRSAGVTPPVNIVLIAEGEEEIGSPHFRQIVQSPGVIEALKKTQGIFMPTSWQGTNGEVSVFLGAKGLVELELVVSGERWGRGPKGDIHSSYKAMVDAPAWRLIQALNSLVTPDGNMAVIDGWFDNVRKLSPREIALVDKVAAAANEAREKEQLGVTHWIDDLPYNRALQRLVQDPTLNIEGLVAGYTGPGGKTILPGKATAKLDLRIVPNQTREEVERKLRAHLDAKGFADVEIRISGGYDPTEVAEDSRLIQAQVAAYKALGVEANLNPRGSGSWPGAAFTAPPVSIPAGHFGIGRGGAAHAPDEYYIVESSNPKIAGITDAALGYAEMMYQFAGVR